MPIRVTSIQRGCVYDGPGVRTTVFLKGCYLSCPWCCNPETINFDKEQFFVKNLDKCGSSPICKSCELKGGSRKKSNCPFGVYEPTFRDYEVTELYNILAKDKSLFVDSGGGVTFSGGEPLLQAEAILPLIQLLKNSGIHVALETSLYAPTVNFLRVAVNIDYWIVDVKFQFGFISRLENNLYLKDFSSDLKHLQDSNSKVMYRMVYSHQAFNRIDDIVRRLIDYRINSIEILACHNLGSNKYEKLGMPVPRYSSPNDEDLIALKNSFEENNIHFELKKV